MRAVLLFLSILVGAACAPFRPAPVPPPTTPQSYANLQGSWEAPIRWWEAWNATELTLVMERALAHGYDVRIARARLAQAQAAARKARAALFPSVDAELAPERRISGGTGLATTNDPLWGLTGLASYEVDLWGRIDAQTQVADLAVVQSEEAVRTATMTVAAETATAWVEMVAARAQARILHQQIHEQEALLAALTERYRAGTASLVDLETQRKALAETRAALPALTATERARQAQLAVLCALPEAELASTHSALPAPWPLPRAGLPADLLEARPDIRATAAQAASTGLDVARAKADLLPQITLTGRLSASGPSLGGIFDTWLVRLAAGLAAPILDGGRRLAEVDRAKAAQEEAILAYGQTVAKAVAEADTALAELKAAVDSWERTRERFEAAQRLLAATMERFLHGMAEYPDVSAARTQADSLKRARIAQHATVLARQIALVRALGRGWQHLFPREIDSP
ncbi:membrane protein [Thermodesulfomicrobium sp. WS]|uniref:TolC family protein n=1 Tax=Thermodesulfomicrobium sp. WS TaxID=3004129 RepID=UPI002490CCC1|nr:TolC family protein [Thermodesulfomicrobium sp. WS]BDV00770.1 membrane protein [Thermodesulfomicrobium sp. WS]